MQTYIYKKKKKKKKKNRDPLVQQRGRLMLEPNQRVTEQKPHHDALYTTDTSFYHGMISNVRNQQFLFHRL
jgi:hypothetical protein